MASVHHLQLRSTLVFWETCSFGCCTACLYYYFCWVCIYMLLYILLNLKVNHHYCIGFIYEGYLLHGIMPVNIEQRRAEIGKFNGCSLHSIVKLHLNLFNLLFNMFLVSFCIITITVCFITNFQILLYIITLFLFLCDFLPFLSPFISYSNFSYFYKLIFTKRSCTNYLYMTSFVDVVYWTYFLHIILLQHRYIYRNQWTWASKWKNQKFLLLSLECSQSYSTQLIQDFSAWSI